MLLAYRQLRFSLYGGAVTTKAPALVVFLLLFLVSGSVEYPMPYASCLVSCSVDWSSSLGQLACPMCYPFWSSACPSILCLMQLSLSEDLGFCRPFYAVHIHTALWDSLYRLCAFWHSFLAFQASDWAVALWDGLSGL